MVMKSRGPVRGSFGMSERRRAAEQSDAEREAAMTPEQHDRVAAYHREQVRLFPGIADLHNADAARHEAEARRKREFVGRPQETRIGATSRAASGPAAVARAAEAMHTPMAEETRRMGLPTMRDSMDAVRAAERARGGTPRTLGVTGASGESARRAVAAGDASREAARRSSLNSHQGAAASHEAAAASYKAEGNHARAQHHADTAARHRMAVREFSRIVPTHSPAAAPAGTTAARLSNRGTESAASSRKLGTARELQASPGSGSLESRRTQAMHQGHHDEHDRRSKAERSSPAARRNLEDAFTTEKRYAQGASDHANRDGTALAHTRAAAAHREAGEAASRAGYSPAQHYARAREHDEEASAAAVAHAVRENRAVQATQHGTATTHTPHDQAMHRATQTGAKGGKFVISATGKKRYVKR